VPGGRVHVIAGSDGHGLEAAMWMLADAARALGRRKLRRTGVVEQQERAEGGAVGLVAEERAHQKAVTDPVAARRARET
jgi:hypothetical protein